MLGTYPCLTPIWWIVPILFFLRVLENFHTWLQSCGHMTVAPILFFSAIGNLDGVVVRFCTMRMDQHMPLSLLYIVFFSGVFRSCRIRLRWYALALR